MAGCDGDQDGGRTVRACCGRVMNETMSQQTAVKGACSMIWHLRTIRERTNPDSAGLPSEHSCCLARPRPPPPEPPLVRRCSICRRSSAALRRPPPPLDDPRDFSACELKYASVSSSSPPSVVSYLHNRNYKDGPNERTNERPVGVVMNGACTGGGMLTR